MCMAPIGHKSRIKIFAKAHFFSSDDSPSPLLTTAFPIRFSSPTAPLPRFSRSPFLFFFGSTLDRFPGSTDPLCLAPPSLFFFVERDFLNRLFGRLPRFPCLDGSAFSFSGPTFSIRLAAPLTPPHRFAFPGFRFFLRRCRNTSLAPWRDFSALLPSFLFVFL